MKKIVIISNYFPPEMGAASNRIKNLADGLYKRGNDVSVICPLPNYPKGKIFDGYRKKFVVEEIINGIKIKRCWIFPSKSRNSIIRLLSMMSFAWSLWFSVFGLFRKKPDVFIIQSPPLIVALSGLVLSKVLQCKSILNVSDIWPLSALELGVIKKGFLYTYLEKIEKINYKLANKIVGQSKEILNHVNKLTTKEFLLYRNVPRFYKFEPKTKSNGNLKIVYAGLLGYAQGILEICKKIDFVAIDAEFHIYGSGMEEQEIVKIINTKKNSNIFFYGVKTPAEIKTEIRKYDIGLVPLKRRIYGAVPSKIFELMQLGTPILYNGGGEAESIIRKNNLGFCCDSNISQLEKTIKEIKNINTVEFTTISRNGIRLHKEKYNFSYSITKFIDFIDDAF